MKRTVAAVLLLLLLCGCGNADADLSRGLALREKLQQSGCSFTATITADYGEKLYEFVMECESDAAGTVGFTVLRPESIAGVTGKVSAGGGKLSFDDSVLAFELLADGELSPVSAPWLLMKTLRSGYLASCSKCDGNLCLTIDDSYEDDALQLDIILNQDDLPQRVHILWQGRRVLSMHVENFAFV